MNIFIASGHRTGSQHICNSLGRLLGQHVTSAIPHLSSGNGQDEHMIHPFVAQTMFCMDHGYIFHQHCKGTKGNATLLKFYGVKTIVCIRNIFDVMLSIKEKMDKGIFIPCMVSPQPWINQSDTFKWEWLSTYIPSWTFQFYASWKNAVVPNKFVKYEEYYADKVAGMRGILEYCGIDNEKYTDEDITKAHDCPDNLNAGKIGRGSKAIPFLCKRRVVQQAGMWGPKMSPMIKEDLL